MAREIVIRISVEGNEVRVVTGPASPEVQPTQAAPPKPVKPRATQYQRRQARTNRKIAPGSRAEQVYDAHTAAPDKNTEALAKVLGMSAGYVSQIMSRLADHGFIENPPWRRRVGIRSVRAAR